MQLLERKSKGDDMTPFMRAWPFLFAVMSSTACSSAPATGGGTASIFHVPATNDELAGTAYYDLPWPNDIRKNADGTIRVEGMPNPNANSLVKDYVGAAQSIGFKGFSPSASGYFRFTGPIDPQTLPEGPQATLDRNAAVQIIDIDPASPEHGKRRLAQTYWRKSEGVYWLGSTLAIAPALGYPLRPNTRYATVVTKRVTALDGSRIEASEDLRVVLGMGTPSARTAAARTSFASAVMEIEAAGVPRADLIHAAVFTTNDPTTELFAIADALPAEVPAPTVDATSWTQKERRADYDVYEGKYGPSPNYQAGTIPFRNLGEGGNFVFDAAGKPVLQSTFDLRFSLVVPNATKCAPPVRGYPIALYAHGTGGDYRSILDLVSVVGADLSLTFTMSLRQNGGLARVQGFCLRAQADGTISYALRGIQSRRPPRFSQTDFRALLSVLPLDR